MQSLLMPLLLPLLATAQMPGAPKIPLIAPITPPRSGGWTPAKLTPLALAARADARLNGLKNAVADWTAILNLPTGRGQAYGRDVVYSPKRFRIETLAVKGVRGSELNKTTWRAEKGALSVLGTGTWEPRGPVARYATLPQPLLPSFLTGFDGVIKRGIAGAKPLTAFLKAAAKAGYAVAAERRATNPVELRLLATKGATRYEFVFAERQMLPTTVRSESVVKGKPLRVLWLGAWGVKPTPLTAADAANYHPPRVRMPDGR